MSSAKTSLYDFLAEQIAAAANGSPLYQAELRFTHHEYTKEDDKGIHLSNVLSTPSPGANGVVEYDARLILTTYKRVPANPDRDARKAAYEAANALALAVAGLIFNDPGLNGRTCNTFCGQMVDDFDSLSTGQFHAVTNLYVVVNQSGAPLPGLWNRI